MTTPHYARLVSRVLDEGGRGPVDRTVGPLVPAGVNALTRECHLGGDIEVGSGISELGATSAVAVDDDSPDLVGATEQT